MWVVQCALVPLLLASSLASKPQSYPCVWDSENGTPGQNPTLKHPGYCEDFDDLSGTHYVATCDTYIDFFMAPCQKENFLGIYSGSYYKYKLLIKVKNARTHNLFVKNINNYPEVHLHELDLSHGDLTEIPDDVSKINRMTILDLSYNRIKTFPITSFYRISGLLYINLSHNEIDSIPVTFSDFSANLRNLHLSHNRLKEVPRNLCYNLNELWDLDLSHNDIRYVSGDAFFTAVSLRQINLSNNKLTNIDPAFSELSNVLEKLDLSHNELTQLNRNCCEPMPKLKQFIASYNQIDTIEDTFFRNFVNLETLVLDHNSITKITEKTFDRNSKLLRLNLNDNPIHTIEGGSFVYTEIVNFKLQNTQLAYVDNLAFESDSTFIYKNTVIDLSGSVITNIDDLSFDGSIGITNLNLSSNAIQNISNLAFFTLSSLQTLDLSFNQLEKLNFNTQKLNHLKELHANNNKIEKIYISFFQHLISLEVLDLSYNNIKEIDPGSFYFVINLHHVNLSYNSAVDIMSNLPFNRLNLREIELTNVGNTILRNGSLQNCLFLESLDVSFGKIKEIEYNAFGQCDVIRVVNLSFNQLESFNVNTESIKHIKELYLDNNQIREINANTFNNLRNLEILNLSNNDIIFVEQNAFQNAFQNVPALKYLDISSTVIPRKSIKLTELSQNFEKLSIGNFNLDMYFESSRYSIRTLELKSCGITDLSRFYFSNIRNLENLNLDDNDVNILNHDTFKNNLPSLASLSLSNNKISTVEPGFFLRLPQIRNVNLSKNNLTDINYGLFNGVEILTSFNLSGNALTTFDVGVLPDTSILSLDNNKISAINFDDVFESNISKLSLGGNGMSCEYLRNAKKINPDKFTKVVTADPANFYIRNINGIPC